MADITSGTLNATPLGDFWIGTVQLAASADDGDVFNLGASTFLGSKVKGIVYASGIRAANLSGSAASQPCSFDSNSGSVTLGYSGSMSDTDADESAQMISNQRRDIFFIARSSTE